MKRKSKHSWWVSKDGSWYDEKQKKFVENPDFKTGNFSTNFITPFKGMHRFTKWEAV